RDHALRAEIVGDVEQGGDEQLVRRRALGHYGFPRTSLRQLLRHKATFGTDRHDNGVLHLLRLDQSEDLGAEVLWPIRPADAPARDLAKAQMDPLDPGRVHEDFVERARGRHTLERTAPELQ